jgi:hypothetical protein
MHIGNYIELVHKGEQDLAKAFRMIADEHGDEPDVKGNCTMLAGWSDEMVQMIKPFADKYGEEKNKEPDRLMNTLFKKPRKGSLALLRDLHDLWLMSNEASLCCILLRQAATGLRDTELITVCNYVEHQSKRQTSWLLTRMKSAAPQTLIAAE